MERIPDQMDYDFRYFTEKKAGKLTKYGCWLCHGQPTTDRRKHCKGGRHQDLVRADEERRNRERWRRAAIDISDQMPIVVDEEISALDLVVGEISQDSIENTRGESLPVEDDEIPLSVFEEEESDDEEGELNWTDMIGIAVGQINSEPEDAILDANIPRFRHEEDEIKKTRPNNSEWYPFPNQEYLVGSLILGYLHKLVSRDLYHQFRSVFTTYHVKLPRWEALREMRARIRKLINHTVVEKETVFGQPVFGLNARELIRDDLMNPLVAPHLEFVPEDARGRDIYKMSQSSKWLKHLNPDLRVQMIESNEKQFYIFEPKFFAKCYQPVIKSNVEQSKLEIRIVSNLSYDDDRLKIIPVDEFSSTYEEIKIRNGLALSECCSGKMIEITNTHVPGNALNSCRYCVLRSEDLKSRKKLPYLAQFTQKNSHGANCPNQLRTMEETIINSKKLWTETKETLDLEKLNKKSAQLAVKDQLNLKFSKQVFAFQAEKISLLAAGEELPCHMDQDIPQKLVDMEKDEPMRMHNSFMWLKGFDSVKDTPVEVLHVFLLGPVKYLFRDFMKGLNDLQKSELLALWYSFNTNSLDIPSIRPSSMVQYCSSLIGKDFRIILQAAPFIFFQFMTPSQINIWSSLCHLGSLIFQTHIEDMDTYISDLRTHIDIFLSHIIKDSAQWINKAKFHMLLHLPESILRFGPATLFATEKFESYNGILRFASIHSNRQSPSQDIAITFSNYHAFRQLLSGGFFWDYKQKKYIQCSYKVINMFSQNPLIQQTLGYNHSASTQNINYPSVKKDAVPEVDRLIIPQPLKNVYAEHEIKQISEVNLNKKQVLKKKYFILFNINQSTSSQLIGRINSIWMVQKPGCQSSYFFHTTVFQKLERNDFYKMREIKRTPHKTFVHTSNIMTGLNVQHDCHRGGCQLEATRTSVVERRKSSEKKLELNHRDEDRYIINCASLASVSWHRKFSELVVSSPTQLEWLNTMHDGLNAWSKVVEKKETKAKKKKPTVSARQMDPSLQ
ncbi:hypothetical protein MJO29_008489 [Puccinia striiformis f. sp. tritici]|nr:hypothetical protein MJO29_008489 [Puccinia striiformis f. sp. tritici]